MAVQAQPLATAGMSDVGMQRVVNEDRFLADPARGLFAVVDGVGGQAAGGRAADVAVAVLKDRLYPDAPDLGGRIREAITLANNEIHRAASGRSEWHGMACVLTVAVVSGERAWIGHVGDTRLYKLHQGRIEKVTPDHSPVGEREDAKEISELEAMRHPRRNEVYRDVGSESHQLDDVDFVDVREIAFEPDAALLLCSDGLTDLVPSEAIHRLVLRFAGKPQGVARALVEAANQAGGKDNVTVVYVEGPQFARARRASGTTSMGRGWRAIAAAVFALGALAAAWKFVDWPVGRAVTSVLTPPPGVVIVRPQESIAAALNNAAPGTTVIVEPGEYRERLTLRDHVRLVSRISRAAALRLPANASESDAAVSAVGVAGAEFEGFRILGDVSTPLGTGVLVRSSSVRLSDLEITGATAAAIDLGSGGDVLVVGVDIHDNSGAGLVARANATPRVSHTAFTRNGRAGGPMTFPIHIEPGAAPIFQRNVFDGLDPDRFPVADPATRSELKQQNWFLNIRPATPSPPPASRGRQGR